MQINKNALFSRGIIPICDDYDDLDAIANALPEELGSPIIPLEDAPPIPQGTDVTVRPAEFSSPGWTNPYEGAPAPLGPNHYTAAETAGVAPVPVPVTEDDSESMSDDMAQCCNVGCMVKQLSRFQINRFSIANHG